MRGLTIVVVSADRERFRAALTLACANAALGGSTTVYAHERAVSLLVPADDPGDAELADAGLPGRRALISTAIESGVRLVACQTGLSLAGVTATDLAEGTETDGLVALLSQIGDDRLVTV